VTIRTYARFTIFIGLKDTAYDPEEYRIDHVEHDFLKASAIADKPGISRGLIRQYTSGAKHPSIRRAKKIESAVKQIAKELDQIGLYVQIIFINNLKRKFNYYLHIDICLFKQ
jgi:hypothetical protein